MYSTTMVWDNFSRGFLDDSFDLFVCLFQGLWSWLWLRRWWYIWWNSWLRLVICSVLKDICSEKENHVVAARPCPNGRFKCASGHCVSNTSRCDGIPQCADVSDEIGCPPRGPNGTYCAADRFTCNNTLCINKNWMCDGGKTFCSSFISHLLCSIYLDNYLSK